MLRIQAALCVFTGSWEMSVFHTLSDGNIGQFGAPGTVVDGETGAWLPAAGAGPAGDGLAAGAGLAVSGLAVAAIAPLAALARLSAGAGLATGAVSATGVLLREAVPQAVRKMTGAAAAAIRRADGTRRRGLSLRIARHPATAAGGTGTERAMTQVVPGAGGDHRFCPASRLFPLLSWPPAAYPGCRSGAPVTRWECTWPSESRPAGPPRARRWPPSAPRSWPPRR
jgi:hypothetical protein